MKRNKLFITGAVLALAFVMGNNISNAAGCGTWYIYKTTTPTCYNEHCGIWDKTALVQKQYSKRKCVKKDNSTRWEYDTKRVHIDCGC